MFFDDLDDFSVLIGFVIMMVALYFDFKEKHQKGKDLHIFRQLKPLNFRKVLKFYCFIKAKHNMALNSSFFD